MENPWSRLPASPPYVLAEDADAIDRINVSARSELRIHTELLPEPFLGRPDAPVVLLGLNPGFNPRDLEHHQDKTFARASRRNLVHAHEEYPFYLLDPALVRSPGHGWWSKRLRHLIELIGLEAVARSLLCVEFFPYHSDKFGSRTTRVKSQTYGFFLVQEALRRGALVVAMRSLRLWATAVPGLAQYGRLVRLRNVQSPWVSPKNCPDGFDAIVAAIRSHTHGMSTGC